MSPLSLRFVVPALSLALVGAVLPHTTAPVTSTSPTPAAAEQSVSPGTSLQAISDRSDHALKAANDAIAAADQVTADIAASGLTIGATSTTVDTSALASHVGKLEDLSLTPPMLVSKITDGALAQVQSVNEKTAALRGQLDAAIAKKKAEEEAAAKAAAEAAAAAAKAAEEARAAEEAAAARKAAASASSGAAVSAPAVNVNVDPASAQGIARSMMASNYGWGDDQFACLVSLWNKESGWRVNAANRSSGAYGIPQALPGGKMASAGADWQTNPATQIAWGLGYISGRYGAPCGAWGHSQSVGWY